MEKNGFAQVLDKLFESFKGAMNNGERTIAAGHDSGSVANVLPKPNSQEIGHGIIVWRWETPIAKVESILVTNSVNQVGLEKDKYVVNLQLPQSEHCAYSLHDDTAKELGQAVLSAWNWQHIWKLHAGDFLLENMSQEVVLPPPVQHVEPGITGPEMQGDPIIVDADVEPETVTVEENDEDFDLKNVQG